MIEPLGFFSNLTKLFRGEGENRLMLNTLAYFVCLFSESQTRRERNQVQFFLLHFSANQSFQRCSGKTVVLTTLRGQCSTEHRQVLPPAIFVTICSFFPIPISWSPQKSLIWGRLWGAGVRDGKPGNRMPCVTEPRLCANREVCKLTQVVCMWCGQAIFNASEICICCAFCHATLFHKARRQGDRRNENLPLKSSLKHVTCTFVRK